MGYNTGLLDLNQLSFCGLVNEENYIVVGIFIKKENFLVEILASCLNVLSGAEALLFDLLKALQVIDVLI